MKINYIVIPLITFFVSFFGGKVTSNGMEWYQKINLPAWTPPGSVIGVVWTILFILATISALIYWNRLPRDSRFWWITLFFVLNAFLNYFWSFLFFGENLIGLAVWEAGLLGLSVLILMVLLWKSSKTASLLLVPYLLWVSFATFLTYSVWAIN